MMEVVSGACMGSHPLLVHHFVCLHQRYYREIKSSIIRPPVKLNFVKQTVASMSLHVLYIGHSFMSHYYDRLKDEHLFESDGDSVDDHVCTEMPTKCPPKVASISFVSVHTLLHT